MALCEDAAQARSLCRSMQVRWRRWSVVLLSLTCSWRTKSGARTFAPAALAAPLPFFARRCLQRKHRQRCCRQCHQWTKQRRNLEGRKSRCRSVLGASVIRSSASAHACTSRPGGSARWAMPATTAILTAASRCGQLQHLGELGCTEVRGGRQDPHPGGDADPPC